MSTKTFQAACDDLWKPQDQSEAARQLKVGRSSMVRYDNGERDIPQELLDKVYGLLIRHQTEVGKLVEKIAAGQKVPA